MKYSKISEIQSKTCDYSSQIKDVHLVSVQKTAECDSSIIEIHHDKLDDIFEEETYCFNKPIPIEPFEWQDLQFRTKYLMVNFSCRGKYKPVILKKSICLTSGNGTCDHVTMSVSRFSSSFTSSCL